ncbi:hypothetical protein ABPG73_016882 [Tetrahymena malaccensis]
MDIVQNQLEASQVLEVNQKCPTHLNKDIEWIRLGVDNDPCVLKCSKCLDKKAGFVDYIYIEDLIESRDDFTFEGWPLQNEPQILQKIKEIASRVSEVDEIKNKIRNAFKNIRMKIDSQLEEKQEEMFKFIDHQKDLLKEYNKICQKEKLIDIVRNMHQNFEKSNQMLIEIIKENNKNQDVNKQVFLNYIQDFNEIIKLDVNAYTKIENNLCEAIKNQNWQIKILDKTEKNICKGFGNQNQQQQIDAPQQEIINRNYVIKVNGLECLSQCVNKKIVDFDFRNIAINIHGYSQIPPYIPQLTFKEVNEESFKALVILDEDPDFLSLQPKTQFTNQSNFPIKFYEYQIPKFIIPEQIMDDTILLKKICLVGYYCAGKDCILGRLQKIGFLSETKATIGTEYSNIIFALKNGQKINLQIQNASGNKKYQEIVYKYTRGTSGFVFCFDITEKKSFEELKEELPKIKEYGVPILILGNKIDLYERRQVDTQLVIDLANQNNLALAICSAKTGENIQEPFDNLAEEIFRRHVIEQFSKINSSGQLQNQQQQQEIKKEQQQQQELKNEWQQKLKKEYQLELKNNIQLQKKNISKNQKNQKCF